MTGKQLKNSILQWAIQGKLVPQDPNDEPASVLLEKIRAEKARLVKEGKIKKDKKESIIYRGEDNSYYEKFADGKVICIDEEIPFEIPDGWEWCRLNNLADIVRGGSPRPAGSTEYYNGSIPFLKVADLTKDSSMYVNSYTATIKEAGLKKTRKVSANTLLLTNSGATLGVPKICTFETTFNDGVAAFLYLSEELKQYVYWFLCAMTDIYRNINQGTAQPNLNTDIIKATLFAVPPIDEQSRIIKKIEELYPLVEKFSIAQSNLSQLNADIYANIKKSILYKAIQGRLVPQDASDEPASVLLQRIKEEKLRLVKDGKLKKKDVIDSTIFRGDDNKYFEKKGKEVVCIDDEIPFDIPDNWCWVRIKYLFQTSSGGTPDKGHPEYYEGTTPWVKVGDLKAKTLEQAEETISVLGMDNSSAKMFPKNTILVAMYCNDAIGKSSILSKPMTTNQAICGLYPNPLVNKEYIYYAIQANRKILQEQSAGGAQKNINQKIVNDLLLPLPPLAEQRRIVVKIEETVASIMS